LLALLNGLDELLMASLVVDALYTELQVCFTPTTIPSHLMHYHTKSPHAELEE
jgi:hypothetical protein